MNTDELNAAETNSTVPQQSGGSGTTVGGTLNAAELDMLELNGEVQAASPTTSKQIGAGWGWGETLEGFQQVSSTAGWGWGHAVSANQPERLLDGWDRTARDGAGVALAGASVEVRVAVDASDEDAAPITRPQLFADAFARSGQANPFTTPSDGRVLFHVPAGLYHIVLTSGGQRRVFRNVQFGQGPEALRRVRTVESRTSGGPPNDPARDDAYIVDSPIGNWSPFAAGSLAIYQAGLWWEVAPDEGYGPVWIRDEALEVRRTGGEWLENSDADLTRLRERAEPGDPPAGETRLWMSNGQGAGDEGDVMVKATNGAGVTKTATLLDFSST